MGLMQNSQAQLQWYTQNEQSPIFELERSIDKLQYQKIATITGTAIQGQGAGYTFTDLRPVNGPTYYRIKVIEGSQAQYSKVVLLSNSNIGFSIKSILNPFRDAITFELETPEDGSANISVIDSYGRVVKQIKQQVSKGLNAIRLNELNSLAKSIYTLRVQMNNRVINKSIVKVKE